MPPRPEYPYPRETLRPGRVVWAKVEGHEWWPARVVRRRAVPREVGPPPGGPSQVTVYVPVVFFTPHGIPAEVDERLDTLEGIMAASMRVLGLGPEEEDLDEAEYAWLPLDCIKPFKTGDLASIEGAVASEDAALKASVTAAEKTLLTFENSAQPFAMDIDGQAGSTWDAARDQSDSDGGWGVSAHVHASLGAGRMRGRGRGGRGRKGRGRGGRRGRGRRGILARGSDDEGSDAELEPVSAGAIKIQVEQIYGWRHPLNEEDKAREREKSRKLEQERHRVLETLRAGGTAVKGNSEAIPAAEDSKAVVQSAAIPETQAVKAENGEPVDQEEADAVAALLDFGGDAPTTAAPAPAGPPAGSTAAAAAAAAGVNAAPGADSDEPEYLVKWAHKSHIHNEWVRESLLMQLARRKLLNFKKRAPEHPCNMVKEQWLRPERFVSHRACPTGPGWEILVKWTGLGYDQATWEPEGEGILLQPEYVQLHRDMWSRRNAAIARSSPAAAEAAATAKAAAKESLQELKEQPSSVRAAPLHAHQLEAVNWLRSMWARGQHAILADEMGLGKTATIITYLQCLLYEFKVTGPLLVVVPQSMIDFWEGEWRFWAGTTANMVCYTGSATARLALHEHELWLSPSCLDGKGVDKSKESIASKVSKAEVVIASVEAVAQDLQALRVLPWEACVVDLRLRGRGAWSKPHAALAELECAHKVLLMGGHIQGPPEELASLLNFVKPEAQIPEIDDTAELSAALIAELHPHCCQPVGKELCRKVTAHREVVLPVELTEAQAECYRSVLARYFEVLADPKPPRYSSHRAAQLKHACTELRKVCNHPYLLPEFDPDADKDEFQDGALPPAPLDSEGLHKLIDHSGKLRVLDQVLSQLFRENKRVLVLSQSTKTLDILYSYARGRHGAASVGRIDSSTPSSTRFQAVQRFNQPHSPMKLVLMTARSCGLGTDLPGVDVVLVYDSDWHPRLDMQALQRAFCVGREGQLTIIRLYARQSVEERVLEQSEKVRGLDVLFQQGHTRSSSSGSRLLEDILKWGAARIFGKESGVDRAASGAAEGSAEGQDGQGPTSMDVDSSTARQQQAVYTDTQLSEVLTKAQAACQNAPATGSSEQAPMGPGLEMVTVREWGDVGKSVEEDLAAAEEPVEEEAVEEAEGDVEGGEEAEGSAEPAGVNRSEATAASSATFWESLLKERWEQLQKEEEDARQAQELEADADEGPTLDVDEEEGDEDGLGHKPSLARSGSLTAGIPGLEEGSRMARGRGRATRALRGRGSLPGGLPQLSGMTAAAVAASGADAAGNPRPISAPAVRAFRGRRRAEGDGDEAVAISIPALHGTLQAADLLHDTGNTQPGSILASPDNERPAKRPRRRPPGMLPTSVVTTPPAEEPEPQEPLQSPERVRQILLREMKRMQTVKDAIAESGTPEHYVICRAYQRLKQIAADLDVAPDVAAQVADMGRQVSDILVMMRQEDEAPSDFQDYTLVAIAGVAAHLLKVPLGEDYGLRRLADKYGHDVTALDQVFWHILTRLSYYRELHLRSQQLEAGHWDASTLQAAERVLDRRGSGAAVSEVDTFADRLQDILRSDLSAVVYSQVSQEQIPLGPLNTLMPLLQLAGISNDANLKTALKSIRECQENLVVLDRTHSIKVQQVQKEYQDFMEKVRSKAQAAIDQANREYQSQKAMLSTRMNMTVDYLQTQLPFQRLSEVAHHVQRAAQQVQATHAPIPTLAAAGPLSGMNSIVLEQDVAPLNAAAAAAAAAATAAAEQAAAAAVTSITAAAQATPATSSDADMSADATAAGQRDGSPPPASALSSEAAPLASVGTAAQPSVSAPSEAAQLAATAGGLPAASMPDTVSSAPAPSVLSAVANSAASAPVAPPATTISMLPPSAIPTRSEAESRTFMQEVMAQLMTGQLHPSQLPIDQIPEPYRSQIISLIQHTQYKELLHPAAASTATMYSRLAGYPTISPLLVSGSQSTGPTGLTAGFAAAGKTATTKSAGTVYQLPPQAVPVPQQQASRKPPTAVTQPSTLPGSATATAAAINPAIITGQPTAKPSPPVSAPSAATAAYGAHSVLGYGIPGPTASQAQMLSAAAYQHLLPQQHILQRQVVQGATGLPRVEDAASNTAGWQKRGSNEGSQKPSSSADNNSQGRSLPPASGLAGVGTNSGKGSVQGTGGPVLVAPSAVQYPTLPQHLAPPAQILTSGSGRPYAAYPSSFSRPPPSFPGVPATTPGRTGSVSRSPSTTITTGSGPSGAMVNSHPPPTYSVPPTGVTTVHTQPASHGSRTTPHPFKQEPGAAATAASASRDGSPAVHASTPEATPLPAVSTAAELAPAAEPPASQPSEAHVQADLASEPAREPEQQSGELQQGPTTVKDQASPMAVDAPQAAPVADTVATPVPVASSPDVDMPDAAAHSPAAYEPPAAATAQGLLPSPSDSQQPSLYAAAGITAAPTSAAQPATSGTDVSGQPGSFAAAPVPANFPSLSAPAVPSVISVPSGVSAEPLSVSVAPAATTVALSPGVAGVGPSVPLAPTVTAPQAPAAIPSVPYPATAATQGPEVVSVLPAGGSAVAVAAAQVPAVQVPPAAEVSQRHTPQPAPAAGPLTATTASTEAPQQPTVISAAALPSLTQTAAAALEPLTHATQPPKPAVTPVAVAATSPAPASSVPTAAAPAQAAQQPGYATLATGSNVALTTAPAPAAALAPAAEAPTVAQQQAMQLTSQLQATMQPADAMAIHAAYTASILSSAGAMDVDQAYGGPAAQMSPESYAAWFHSLQTTTASHQPTVTTSVHAQPAAIPAGPRAHTTYSTVPVLDAYQAPQYIPPYAYDQTQYAQQYTVPFGYDQVPHQDLYSGQLQAAHDFQQQQPQQQHPTAGQQTPPPT